MESITHSAVIVFNDKDKAPIEILKNSSPRAIREKVSEMFEKGFVVVDETCVVKETKKKVESIMTKFFALEEVDHVEIKKVLERS